MTSKERFVCIASCGAVLAGIAACGGAEVAPKSAPSAAPPAEISKDRAFEPSTIEQAQDQIALARAELESLESARSNDEAKKAEGSPKKAPAPTTSPQGGASGSVREEKVANDADSCGNPCRALASMQRAVESLCRMTGDSDNRCVDAKRTLTLSTTRIASCKCDAR